MPADQIFKKTIPDTVGEPIDELVGRTIAAMEPVEVLWKPGTHQMLHVMEAESRDFSDYDAWRMRFTDGSAAIIIASRKSSDVQLMVLTAEEVANA